MVREPLFEYAGIHLTGMVVNNAPYAHREDDYVFDFDLPDDEDDDNDND